MKFWRTFAAIALAVCVAAPAMAGMSNTKGCGVNTDLVPIWGLTLCKEMRNDTQTSFGNGFPWENSTFFFSSFRNQYLYPSATINAAKTDTTEINGISARASSFSGSSTNVYGSFPNGDDSSITVMTSATGSLDLTFSVNPGATQYCQITGNDADPIVIGDTTGPNGSLISTCESCAEPFDWCVLGDINALTDLMVDQKVAVGTGTSGAGVWDVTSADFGQGCPEPERAYGSGSFANPNHMTTALGVDGAAFVWVFGGLAPPPAATVEQQIKEIVRLLLTPQGLRCSGLDLVPGDDVISDHPIAFPNGKDIDPIQPQVRIEGNLITGDEMIDDLRQCGWNCP